MNKERMLALAEKIESMPHVPVKTLGRKTLPPNYEPRVSTPLSKFNMIPIKAGSIGSIVSYAFEQSGIGWESLKHKKGKDKALAFMWEVAAKHLQMAHKEFWILCVPPLPTFFTDEGKVTSKDAAGVIREVANGKSPIEAWQEFYKNNAHVCYPHKYGDKAREAKCQ